MFYLNFLKNLRKGFHLFQLVFIFYSYEPELHPGVTYKCKDPKATLKIFSTGSVTITAPSVANVQRAVEHIYPLVEVFAKPKTKQDKLEPLPKIPEKTK
jgi:TATA-box binding protein (TBP) (component of TFIID and TFIIIB)